MPTPSLRSALLAALVATGFASTAVLAQPLSGGSSAGGAEQGGSGAPGGGTGVPGAVAKGMTASGIGTSATRQPGRMHHRRRMRHR